MSAVRMGRFVPRAETVDREDFIVKLADGQAVLHVGLGGWVDDDDFTDFALGLELDRSLHGKLRVVAETLAGIDINPRTVEAFSKTIPGRYHHGDITDPRALEDLDASFSLVVLSDVIEHLDSVRPALQNVARLMTSDGTAIITTVNAYGFERILKMLARYESVHPEHTAYFSFWTMHRLLAMNGLRISRFKYYRVDRASPAGWPSRIAFLAARLVSLLLPQFSEGLVFVVERDS